MIILHKQNGPNGFFYIGEEAEPLAQMTYHFSGEHLMVIEHTEVSDALRGQNAGYQLVHTAVEYARANNMKILPLCPFAAAVFKKKPEYGDVWKKE